MGAASGAGTALMLAVRGSSVRQEGAYGRVFAAGFAVELLVKPGGARTRSGHRVVQLQNRNSQQCSYRGFFDAEHLGAGRSGVSEQRAKNEANAREALDVKNRLQGAVQEAAGFRDLGRARYPNVLYGLPRQFVLQDEKFRFARRFGQIERVEGSRDARFCLLRIGRKKQGSLKEGIAMNLKESLPVLWAIATRLRRRLGFR